MATLTKRSITEDLSTTSFRGSSPTLKAQSTRRLVIHKSERARATPEGAASPTKQAGKLDGSCSSIPFAR